MTTLMIKVTDATEEQHSAVVQALRDAGLPPRQWSITTQSGATPSGPALWTAGAMSEDLTARLRAAIEGRKALATAATQGEWIPEGGIYVGHPTSIVVDWVHRDEDLAHIVANQPSAVLRHCQADLTELARHTPKQSSRDCPVCVTGAHWVDEGGDGDGNEYGHDELEYEASPCRFVRYLAEAYGITKA